MGPQMDRGPVCWSCTGIHGVIVLASVRVGFKWVEDIDTSSLPDKHQKSAKVAQYNNLEYPTLPGHMPVFVTVCALVSGSLCGAQ